MADNFIRNVAKQLRVVLKLAPRWVVPLYICSVCLLLFINPLLGRPNNPVRSSKQEDPL